VALRYVWPGGGITYMVDVLAMPDNAFGYVPTPAIVGPIEFTMRLSDYRALGGHMDHVRQLADVLAEPRVRRTGWRDDNPWPSSPEPMVGAPQGRLLPDGRRLHLQHGPIDLVIEAFGPPGEVARAYRQAEACFADLLATLVRDLPALRAPIGEPKPVLSGAVARRMVDAVWPHRAVFVTPMAAVAGAVADEVLEALAAGRELAKAYVNDGGDIALYLTPGERFAAGMVAELESPAIDGIAIIAAEMPVRGLATSGRGGRSFSLGIATQSPCWPATPPQPTRRRP